MITRTRYKVLLFVQLSILLIDLLLNAFADCFREDNSILLLLFMLLGHGGAQQQISYPNENLNNNDGEKQAFLNERIQDSLQILAITLLLISLFQTNVFQAGFVELLVDRFRATVLICMTYLILTIIVQVYILTTRWSNPMKHYWARGLLFFFLLQRVCSCMYYYFYKRAILRISDPRFYDDEWINHRVNHIN